MTDPRPAPRTGRQSLTSSGKKPGASEKPPADDKLPVSMTDKMMEQHAGLLSGEATKSNGGA